MKYLYRQTTPEHVKFQRIVMGWLAIASLFLHDIDIVWAFFTITVLGFLSGSELSIPTLFYKVFHSVFKHNLVRISAHHIRYYQINRAMDFIDHLLRFVASSIALTLYYNGLETAAWLLIAFLSVFMMLSAYFGFCLSALTYIALENIRHKLGFSTAKKCTSATELPKRQFNENCTLARRCFTPYKRCDSCHINITQCLGTKFNSLMLIIGVLMALFLFIENPVFVHLNILLVMGLLFWLGYQINYSTDALAQSNDENIILSNQLKKHIESLEDEVKKRTSEIEHLATHDLLTGLLNRFSFEKLLEKAHLQADKKKSHLAFIDLDKFKQVNDTVGHLAGDSLLKNIADLVVDTVGPSSSVARLGGDEFAVLFNDVSQTEAFNICQNICEKAAAYTFVWEDQEFKIGTSIGLVTLESTMQDIKAILHHADQACYTAKKSGRSQVSLHRS